MEHSTENYKASSDVWFIAFLMHSDVLIKKYDVFERGKVRCYFELNDEEWQDYKLKFNNSDLIKFKALIQQVKDLSF